jgi:aconitate hydratase
LNTIICMGSSFYLFYRRILMIKLYESGVFLKNGSEIVPADADANLEISIDDAKKGTMAYSILEAHNTTDDMKDLTLKFDAMASHDITFVGIVQTAKASGLKKFPLPYVLTNCHNSLCAVGGTINEDDHMFGLSAAKKYGGIYVPAHQAVIHSYMRENFAGCGKMILGSDSHTRYGALGTMAIGEGGGELVKQLLEKTYDVPYPKVVGVKLNGKPKAGIGSHDVALAIIGKVFQNGYVKNSVMEFFGDGIKNLNVEFRNGIDVMTTETTCLTSIWATDEQVKNFLDIHHRVEEYKELNPADVAYYDGMIEVNLDEIESMIALPAHPSNVFSIRELYENLDEILTETEANCKKLGMDVDLKSKVINGKLRAEQGVIGGCSGGTFDNIVGALDILKGHAIAEEFTLSIYPGSQPAYMRFNEMGLNIEAMKSGAIMRTAFCGPCFGAGDTPANNQLSVRHNTRNFPSREGSKPGLGQTSAVALMDAKSIAATALNGGIITAATDLDVEYTDTTTTYKYDDTPYKNKVHNYGKNPVANPEVELIEGPNIKPWPEMPELTENILYKVTAFIDDPVTTTDELIPSGETSSFRSNPYGLSEFTLSRRVPEYVGKSKLVREFEYAREKGENPFEMFDELKPVYEKVKTLLDVKPTEIGIGSLLFANKPGDGSAREQAASCQKVLGGWGNICYEYATKRYRSNVINWGMLPFTTEEKILFGDNDYLLVTDVRKALEEGKEDVTAYVLGDEIKKFNLKLTNLTPTERQILLDGCLINYYRKNN